MTSAVDRLEQKRQMLLARVALQRFALRSGVAGLTASLRPQALLAGWRRPALLAATALVSQWLRSRGHPAAGAVRLLALSGLAARAWSAAKAWFASRR